MQKRKRFTLALCFLLIISIVSTVAVAAAEGVFTIKKVDQNKEPLEGVEFEVYGKPVLSSMTVKVKKRFDGADPIVTNVTIGIESTDGGGFQESFTVGPGAMSKEFTLKPGSYRIWEEIPEASEYPVYEEYLEYSQSFLKSCEFTISKSGEITISDGEEWIWHRRDYFGNTDNEGSSQFVEPGCKIVADGNEITITNITEHRDVQVQE